MFSETILTHILYKNKCLPLHFHPWAEWAPCLSLMLTIILHYRSSAVEKYRTFHTAVLTYCFERKASYSMLPALDKLLSGHLLLDRWNLSANFIMHSSCSLYKNLCAEIVI